MVHISGEDLFGRVDRVPGLFFIATLCAHHYGIPYDHKESYLVFEKGANLSMFKGPTTFSGIPIKLCPRSVRHAYCFSALMLVEVVVLLATIYYVVSFAQGKSDDLAMAIFAPTAAVLLFALIVLCNRGTKAHPRRAFELAEQYGIDLQLVMDAFQDRPDIDAIRKAFETEPKPPLSSEGDYL